MGMDFELPLVPTGFDLIESTIVLSGLLDVALYSDTLSADTAICFASLVVLTEVQKQQHWKPAKIR